MATISLVLVLTLGLVLVSMARITRDKCEPDCTGKQPGDMVADPMNCRQFYFCLDGGSYTETPFPCNPGTIFSEEKCVPGDDCVPLCNKRSLCQFECIDVEISKKADQYDCTVYSDCASGRSFKCPSESPFFDGHSCQTDEQRCCSCSPFCRKSDAGHFVIDMVDCKKRYYCTEIGIPQYASTCSSGNVDILSDSCSETTPCVTLCTNVVGPNGCIDIFTCEESGYFAKCRGKCGPEYYHCTNKDIGNIVSSSKCTDGNVFHPETHLCVDPSKCPFQDASE
ncbi:uncharacterized protein [Panulirus ornatus]|uniref:uncharacterized protein isoform X3 n=1 Tax=Panulirus ornatus TaxID=150431 RepID=UPI003A888E51